MASRGTYPRDRTWDRVRRAGASQWAPTALLVLLAAPLCALLQFEVGVRGSLGLAAVWLVGYGVVHSVEEDWDINEPE